nr:MAG: hypothetical protein DIU78_25775 [Pseudomonadota bacterium]
MLEHENRVYPLRRARRVEAVLGVNPPSGGPMPPWLEQEPPLRLVRVHELLALLPLHLVEASEDDLAPAR